MLTVRGTWYASLALLAVGLLALGFAVRDVVTRNAGEVYPTVVANCRNQNSANVLRETDAALCRVSWSDAEEGRLSAVVAFTAGTKSGDLKDITVREGVADATDNGVPWLPLGVAEVSLLSAGLIAFTWDRRPATPGERAH